MADYSKLKVAELKEELKARGIPLSGLKLKQNFIDKLIEADALGQTNTSGAFVTPPAASEAEEATEQDPAADAHDAQTRDEKTPSGDVTLAQPVAQENIAEDKGGLVFPTSANGEKDAAGDEAQAQAENGEDVLPGGVSETLVIGDGAIATAANEQNELPVAEVNQRPTSASIDTKEGTGSPSTPRETVGTTLPPSRPAPSSSTSTPPAPVNEWIEGSKKRKRRSVTPPPSAADIALKRARANDGSPRITKLVGPAAKGEADVAPDFVGQKVSTESLPERSALEQMQAVVDTAEIDRERDELPASEQMEVVDATHSMPSEDNTGQEPLSEKPSKHVRSPEKQSLQLTPGASLFAGLKRRDTELPEELPERSMLTHQGAKERVVAPALHPATRSLYMRNFKRPLHLPTLRAHLAKIARGPISSSTTDEDPIATYFLDSIRTHALISFRSISAASRVRSALHETRYPDEKTRDPLWVDFIPDDKVQSWIGIETDSGGRGGAQRWEVVYEAASSGIEAVLQEVGAGARPRRPSPTSRRQSMSGPPRQPSMPDVQMHLPVAGVHPDRLPLVPQEPSNVINARRADQHQASQSETSGTGFRALDELFSFTTAKPKLYYKPVSHRVVGRRRDMIKDLRVGHADMGKSGDEDMKRYSFEVYRGEEEWVDKGPEFGYGRRGLERMRGGAPSRGGYRGGGGGGGGIRGGFRERDRDDTWRAPR
jgi:hypothetical protein